ncbi:TPA: hypothetical protein N0F65_001339, partial [Lagenidium giganteum]
PVIWLLPSQLCLYNPMVMSPTGLSSDRDGTKNPDSTNEVQAEREGAILSPPPTQRELAGELIAQAETQDCKEAEQAPKPQRSVVVNEEDMRVFNMNMAEIDVPMYERGQNFNHRRRRFLSKMAAHGMVDIVLGIETEHDRMNDRERRCFRAREAKANGLLVAKLSDDIGDPFLNDVYAGRVAVLWKALECEFGRGDDANTIFIRRDIYNRRLRHGKRVGVYVNDLLRMRSDINRNNEEGIDKELARIMLSNVLNVYPEVTREYDDNARRNIFATSRLYAVERLTQQLDDNRRGGQRGNSNGRGLDGRQVNNRGRSRSVSFTSPSKRRKNETVEQTKARSYCARCGGKGHWWRECSGTATTKWLETCADKERQLNENGNNNQPLGMSAMVSRALNHDAASSRTQWILHSGSEVNVSGNIDLFTQWCDDGSHVLYMANGAEQVVTQKGKLLMKVLNEHTKQWEDRILED